MLYVMFAEDVADSRERRAPVRAAHLSRLEQLQAEGRLVLGGVMPAIDAEDSGPAGQFGSLIVAEFNSLEEAEAWLAADPFVAAGVYARTMVRPFKKAALQ